MDCCRFMGPAVLVFLGTACGGGHGGGSAGADQSALATNLRVENMLGVGKTLKNVRWNGASIADSIAYHTDCTSPVSAGVDNLHFVYDRVKYATKTLVTVHEGDSHLFILFSEAKLIKEAVIVSDENGVETVKELPDPKPEVRMAEVLNGESSAPHPDVAREGEVAD